ncbi:MAG: hypothetical protein WC911_03480 [Thermoleophilia bacterium]
MVKLYKLSNVREAMTKATGKPIAGNLMDYYTKRDDFPKPVISEPIRLWDGGEVDAWVAQEARRRIAS